MPTDSIFTSVIIDKKGGAKELLEAIEESEQYARNAAENGDCDTAPPDATLEFLNALRRRWP